MKVLLTFLFLILISYSLRSQSIDSITYHYLCEKDIEVNNSDNSYLYNELMKWIDTPYRYAGNSLKGIDCSGLTKKIYEEVYNSNLSGGSANIYKQITPIENKADLCEGDLVFFKIKKNQISHIGIFLKDGNFVHASVRLGVIISNLSEEYYQKHYFSGGRIP